MNEKKTSVMKFFKQSNLNTYVYMLDHSSLEYIDILENLKYKVLIYFW